MEDNGLGLSPEEVEYLMFQMRTHQNSSAKKGYGLVNISERLFHLYGERAGIVISSEPGGMTTVGITIPYSTEK